jgi:hypothetical protein
VDGAAVVRYVGESLHNPNWHLVMQWTVIFSGIFATRPAGQINDAIVQITRGNVFGFISAAVYRKVQQKITA